MNQISRAHQLCLVALVLVGLGISAEGSRQSWELADTTQCSAGLIIQPLVFGGKEAKAGQFPSFVAIAVEVSEGTYFQGCGGTILGPRIVLTAAHCLLGIEGMPLYVSPSIYPGQRWNETGAMKYRVIKSCSAKTYVPSSVPRPDDYAILVLDQPIEYDGIVGPACLPDAPLTSTDRVISVGLGYVQRGLLGAPAQILQFTPMNYIQSSDSFATFANQDEDAGNCKGDSGSPFYDSNPFKHSVVGVLSGGYGRCSEQTMAVDVFYQRQGIIDLVDTCY